MTTFLPASLAIIFGAAFIGPAVSRLCGKRAGWVLGLGPAAAFVLLFAAGGPAAAGTPVVYEVDWFAALGASFALRLDGLALLMGLLVSGIGTLIVIYTGGYMKGHPQIGRFYLYLLAFMGSMTGVVLSDNLVLMFVFWELTSITSYLLIGFKHEEKESRRKALQALLVTGLGGMSFLAGAVLIAVVTGTFSLTEINASGDVLREHGLYTAIVILILGGAFTKSAQVPFHFWLPNAMAAPTPVSAFLHSATMVKAGVFLLARLSPGLGDTALWNVTLSAFGGVTLVLAVLLGLFQKDLKSILAYTTLAVLGLLTMLLGIGTAAAFKAMVGFLLAHALYKAALFMVAGSVDHETGTRDVTLLRGLRGVMPITAAAGGLAALSMCGLPPFFGFLGKELVYKAGVALEGPFLVLLVFAFVGNFLMFGLALNAGLSPFFGKSSAGSLPKHPHEAPPSMWTGPVVLGALGLLLGILPRLVDKSFVAPAVAAIKGVPTTEVKLALWHGFNLPLLLSGLTVAAGIGVFLARRRFWAAGDRVLSALRPRGAEAAYEKIFDGTMRLSKWQTAKLQTGRLHDYVFFIAGSATLLIGWALFRFTEGFPTVAAADFDPWIAALVLMMGAAAFMAVISDRYFLILGALGSIGFGIALLFAYYGAPDLAITQLMVEALTVVLFMFVIYGLPSIRRFSGRWTVGRDAVLAGVFGTIVGLLAWLAVDLHFGEPISDTLAAMSYPEAKGKNIVNVILVDFRALDTFGEITVVASAALGIAALMSSRVYRLVKKEGGEQ